MLGNGDIWEADDALRMVRETGCAGVVVGRGCLGRPWLFADLAAAFAGAAGARASRPAARSPRSMRRHAELLAEWLARGARRHRLPQARRLVPEGLRRSAASCASALAQASSLAELDDLLARLDLDQPFPDVGRSASRAGARPAARGGVAARGLVDKPRFACRAGRRRTRRRRRLAPMRRRLAGVAVGIAVLGGLIAVQPSAARAPGPARTFHSMPCPANTFPAHVRVDCGFIRVPEWRAHPNGRKIRVAAAVMHTAARHPRPDPIVFLDGGPSFGAISPFAPTYYFTHAAYAKRRDVILVDTRGTGLSRPRLGCPEVDRAEVDAFYAGPTVDSRAAPIYRHAIRACRHRLIARNIHLAAYNTAESAADLDALRRALGVQQWNLLAISADGPLGLTYMRLYGDGIRSSVIDSGQSTQMLWGLDYDRGLSRQLAAVFRGCRANASCNAAYPGLRHAFYRKVHSLQAHPVTISLPQFEPRPVALSLDGVGLYADAIYSIFPGDEFDPNQVPDLLDRLWRETHGELVAVYHELLGNGPVTNGHASAFAPEGKSLSYICHDESNFTTRADLRRAARDLPPFAPRYLDPGYDLADGSTAFISPAGCAAWNVGRADPVQHRAVHSDIPTLVLAGEYDAGVPAYIVRQVTARLTHARYYKFPASAHLQLASYTNGSGCARAIATQFLAHPTVRPDSSCVADLPPLDFTIPPPARVHASRAAAGRFAPVVQP